MNSEVSHLTTGHGQETKSECELLRLKYEEPRQALPGHVSELLYSVGFGKIGSGFRNVKKLHSKFSTLFSG